MKRKLIQDIIKMDNVIKYGSKSIRIEGKIPEDEMIKSLEYEKLTTNCEELPKEFDLSKKMICQKALYEIGAIYPQIDVKEFIRLKEDLVTDLYNDKICWNEYIDKSRKLAGDKFICSYTDKSTDNNTDKKESVNDERFIIDEADNIKKEDWNFLKVGCNPKGVENA